MSANEYIGPSLGNPKYVLFFYYTAKVIAGDPMQLNGKQVTGGWPYLCDGAGGGSLHVEIHATTNTKKRKERLSEGDLV